MTLRKLRENLYNKINVSDVELYRNGTFVIAFLREKKLDLDAVRKICEENICSAEITITTDPQNTFIKFYEITTNSTEEGEK